MAPSKRLANERLLIVPWNWDNALRIEPKADSLAWKLISRVLSCASGRLSMPINWVTMEFTSSLEPTPGDEMAIQPSCS